MWLLMAAARYVGGLSTRYPLADRADSLSCQPLFVVNAGRSGSTLLQSMLVAGGQVAIPPEAKVISPAIVKYLLLQFLGWPDLCRLTIALFESHACFPLWETSLRPAYQAAIRLPSGERSLARIIDEVFVCYRDQRCPGAEVWGDKSPINTLHLPRILRTFPGARYLHLVRDGRDVVASMVARGIAVNRATSRWIACVEQVLALQRKLRPEQFLEVRYEALVTRPAETLAMVCMFAGVEYREAMLDFWKLPSTTVYRRAEHHSNLAKPLFSSSVGGWRRRLSPEDQVYVEKETAPLRQRVGYAD
jgi:hypothetical protein